ncbi:MAG: cysteine desulfurase [Patescibacteria group bacterium]|nr:cysteine desulfurase [Patescibacteria group bacterium]
MRKIYFDFAATTPVREEVLLEMMPYFTEKFGNPSSLHWWGQQALKAVDDCREMIMNLINAQSPNEIIFTSSATESNNLAIKGLAFFYYFKKGIKPHFLTSTIEHDSILKIFDNLEELGLARISYVKPRSDSLIYFEDIINHIEDQTKMIVLHYVNSELGTIQRIKEIANQVKKTKSDILFHVDAVQAGFENLDVQSLGIDMMTLSSHKIYGPKGVALLYKRSDIELVDIISGSGQENSLRSGTEMVPLIVGFAKALELAISQRENINQLLTDLRDYFILKTSNFYDKIFLNTKVEISSPKILNVYFPTRTADELLFYLDSHGIAVSAGTACQSRAALPSSVISHLFSPERAKKSLRVSFGLGNKFEDIDFLVECLNRII